MGSWSNLWFLLHLPQVPHMSTLCFPMSFPCPPHVPSVSPLFSYNVFPIFPASQHMFLQCPLCPPMSPMPFCPCFFPHVSYFSLMSSHVPHICPHVPLCPLYVPTTPPCSAMSLSMAPIPPYFPSCPLCPPCSSMSPYIPILFPVSPYMSPISPTMSPCHLMLPQVPSCVPSCVTLMLPLVPPLSQLCPSTPLVLPMSLQVTLFSHVSYLYILLAKASNHSQSGVVHNHLHETLIFPHHS